MNKIAIILPANYPVPAVRGGAVESLIYNLILQNEKEPTFEFTVFTIADKQAMEKQKNFQHTRFVNIQCNKKVDELSYLVYRFFKKLFRISLPDRLVRMKMIGKLDPEKYDYVLFEAGEVFCLKVYGKKLPVAKTLVHAHGMIDPFKSVDKYFSYYLPISKFVGDYWRKGSDRSLNSYKVWRNCVITDNFRNTLGSFEMQQLKEKYGLKDSDFIIIYVGRLIPEKGVLEFLKAKKELDEENIKFLIVGSAKFDYATSTPYERQIQEISKEYDSEIIFTGFVPNDQIKDLYAISDVAIVPSIWDEPAGLVVLEAMAAGKPIITTGTGGIKEFIDDECALFIDRNGNVPKQIAESILRLKKDSIVREKMGSSAMRRAAMFDMTEYLHRLDAIISEINEEN